MDSTAHEFPSTDVDLFSEAFVEDPYPALRDLRDLAGAVHVPHHDFWAITRYDDVRDAASSWELFTSAEGVGLLDEFNAPTLGSVLASDPPRHSYLRGLLSEKLSPRALRGLRADVQTKVDRIVDDALQTDVFDAVTAITQQIPVRVVGDLIGVPEEGRSALVPGADAVFTSLGPMTPALQERFDALRGYEEFMATAAERGFTPGSWGATLFDEVGAGRLDATDAAAIIAAYLVAGIDTTANGIASMLWSFATVPGLWDRLRAEPGLAPSVFEEALRLESPVQAFFRVATRDVDIDGVTVPRGARVLLHFGSANRDERHYADADRFAADRNPLDHLAFGYGIHGCAGQGLARLEASSLIRSLLERVEAFALAGDPVRHYNPVIRGLQSLPVQLTRRR